MPDEADIIRPPHGGWLRPFKKGETNNPGGGALSAYHAARRVCADASPHAIQRQIEMMDDKDSRVAMIATEAVLNRGIGKPRDHSAEDQQQRHVDLSQLTVEERRVLARLLSVALGGKAPL
jgi:hypothetical protein